MVFGLRIDLESHKGIKEGLPNLLRLLRKYNFKASFYLVMGGESTLLEILKNSKSLKSSKERELKVWKLGEKIRMVLFPKDFVKENLKGIKNILKEGHELGLHGWKHRIWTRGTKIRDIQKQIYLAFKRYQEIFKKKPESFASPAFRIDKKIMKILNEKGIKVISDLPGERIFKIQETSIINVPITIKGENNSPIIEDMVSKGHTDKEILEKLKKEIERNRISTMYIHGLYEGIWKINLLEGLFSHLSKNKIKVKKIEEIAKIK